MTLDRVFSGILLAILLGAIGLAVFSYASETKISLSPKYLEVLPGDSFTVNISVSDADGLSAWQVVLKYNDTIINCTSAWVPENNVFAGRTCLPLPPVLNEHTVDGYAYTIFGSSLYAESVNVTEGLLVRLNFTAEAYGLTQLQIATRENPAQWRNVSKWFPEPIHYSMLLDSDSQQLPYTVEGGDVAVGPWRILALMSSEGGTTNPPSGTYKSVYGQNVIVTAVPCDYHVFDYWLLDESYAGSSASITVPMMENHTLQPVFAHANFTLTISSGSGGATDPPPGTHTFLGGEVVQILVTANLPYRFSHWILDGSSTIFDNPASILMDHNCTVEAVLSEVYYTKTIYIRPDGTVYPPDVPVQSLDDDVFVFTGTITDAIIVVQKSSIVVDGNGHLLQGSGSGEGFSLYGVSNVTIRNTSIRGFDRGICLFASSLNTISQNNITSNKWLGIALYYSSNNTIIGNNLTANNDAGIRVECSSNWNIMVGNNLVANKWLGIYIDSSSNNSIHHNNWANNTNQAYIASNSYHSANFWDDGFEGNYWSGHAGFDSDYDGIMDTPLILDENNVDHYPLTGKYYRFNTSVGYPVNVDSNSTIESFHYSEADRKMILNVRGPNGTTGYCRILTEHRLLDVNHIRVLIDNGSINPLYVDYDLRDNTTHRWIYIAYEHSSRKVEILEDFMPPAVSILFPEYKTYPVNNVSLVFTLDESACWSGYSLDGAINVTVGTNTTLSNLLEGPHDIVVYANDTVGNMGLSSVVSFTVDTIAPNIGAVLQIPGIDEVLPEDIVKINVTVTDDVSGVKRVTLIYACANESGTWNDTVEMTYAEESSWNASFPEFPYGTLVTYIIMAEDNAGHAATSSVECRYQVIPEFPPSSTLHILAATLLLTATTVCIRRRKAVSTQAKNGPGRI